MALTLSQSWISAGPFLADDPIFALLERTARFMFIFLFNVVSQAADHDFTDDKLENCYTALKVRVKRQERSVI